MVDKLVMTLTPIKVTKIVKQTKNFKSNQKI